MGREVRVCARSEGGWVRGARRGRPAVAVGGWRRWLRRGAATTTWPSRAWETFLCPSPPPRHGRHVRARHRERPRQSGARETQRRTTRVGETQTHHPRVLSLSATHTRVCVCVCVGGGCESIDSGCLPVSITHTYTQPTHTTFTPPVLSCSLEFQVAYFRSRPPTTV